MENNTVSSKPKNLKELIILAIKEKNPLYACRASDIMRHKGLKYNDQYALVEKLTGASLAEWDELLYEGETSGDYL